MSAKPTDIILSIALGLLAIYVAHSFLITDACLDMGGAIDTETGTCLNENHLEQYTVLSPAVLIIYFVIGLVVALLSALTIRMIRRNKNG